MHWRLWCYPISCLCDLTKLDINIKKNSLHLNIPRETFQVMKHVLSTKPDVVIVENCEKSGYVQFNRRKLQTDTKQIRILQRITGNANVCSLMGEQRHLEEPIWISLLLCLYQLPSWGKELKSWVCVSAWQCVPLCVCSSRLIVFFSCCDKTQKRSLTKLQNFN